MASELQYLIDEVKKLKNRKSCGILVYPTFDDFPRPGKTCSLYVDESTDPNEAWRWDKELEDYVQVGGGGTGGGLVEGYRGEGDFFEDAGFTIPIVGETGTIYVDLNTDELYRWNGTTFVIISPPPDLSLKADLVGGKVPESQLPSYVDDVIEGYLNTGVFYEEVGLVTPITGESDKIYIDLLTEKTYRWSGSLFVEVSSGSVQVNSDWNSVSGVSEILNKPTIITKTVIENEVLLAANFSLNAGFYEYNYSNVLIKANSFVTVIPLNATISIVRDALFTPSVTVTNGNAKIYCTNLPSGNMNVDILILT